MAEGGSSSSSSAAASAAQRLAKAEEYKSTGNDCYKKKEYKAAIGKYHRALLFIKDLDMGATRRSMKAALGLTEPGRAPGGHHSQGAARGGDRAQSEQATIPQHMMNQAAEYELSCLNNLAACLLQLPEPDYSKVEYYCNRVLERQSRNGKALYRRGVARYHQHDYEGAHQSLQTAQEITPGDSNIKRYLQLCDQAIAKQARDERTRYKGMFDKMAAQGEEA